MFVVVSSPREKSEGIKAREVIFLPLHHDMQVAIVVAGGYFSICPVSVQVHPLYESISCHIDDSTGRVGVRRVCWYVK